MKLASRIINTVFVSLLIFSSVSCVTQKATIPTPPVTKIGTVVDTLHGVEIADPYRWLEDQTSPETRAWINQQNAYTDEVLKNIPNMDAVKKRLTELLRIDYVGTPSQRGDRYFLYKKFADQELYSYYYRDGLEGEDKLLLDPHLLSEDLSISVGSSDISDDGKLLAYSVRKGGQDEYYVCFMNVDDQTNFTDTLPYDYYLNISMNKTKTGVYYSTYDPETGSKIFYHQFGESIDNDKLIYSITDNTEKMASGEVSRNGQYLIIPVHHGSAGINDVYFKNIRYDNNPIETLVEGIDASFNTHTVDNRVFIVTDWEAPNQRILMADLKKPAVKNWKEIIPHSDLVMTDLSLVGGKLAISYLDTVKSRVSIFETDGGHVGDITFPGLGTVSGLSGRWDSDEAFYSFTSFDIPKTVYRYSLTENSSDIFNKSSVEVDSDNIEVKQVWYSSKDGTRIPMFVVHKKGIKLDSSNPTILYGYGGFGISQKPAFSSTWITWVENGGILCRTNLRGGGEFGEDWHKAGMFEKKQNTHDDFYAAAEWLIENKYTSTAHLSAMGGSQGGLLTGVAATQRSDLFKAVVCTWPLLDMLRYDQFLVGKFWISEYGTAQNPDQFPYIYNYSPYHNVKEGTDYPAIFFETGDNDTRVDPCHARKMTALMQAANGSDNPIVLRYFVEAGHSGGKTTSQHVEDISEKLGFLFWQLQ